MQTTYDQYIISLQKRGITPDASQSVALHQLSTLSQTLQSPLATFFKKPKGLYFWGGVGRGKTLLMDTFYQHLNISRKKRMHFHDFMHTIHNSLKDLAGETNPLKKIAKTWRKECQVLCLDECTVDDVADALILGELLKSFFKSGIVFITTSNTHPDNLYKNGVQRQLFLKAIDAIHTYCNIVQVDNGEDYRHRALHHEATYLPDAQTQHLEILFNQLATGIIEYDQDIVIDERRIRAKAIAHRMIWFEFPAICMTYRSTPDYLKLVKLYDTFFISHIPVLSEKDIDAVRRFVHLIDVLYDHHSNLVFSAAADVSQLYQGDMLKGEFLRTASRLQEMRQK